MTLNRRAFQELTRKRLREARLLLRNRQYDGAYYLAGLAVECGLKACISRQTRRHDFPSKDVVVQSYTHDLTKLLKTAGLERDLDSESRANTAFAANWAVVKDWAIESRYTSNGRQKAEDLYGAVTARQHGVMSWIRQLW